MKVGVILALFLLLPRDARSQSIATAELFRGTVGDAAVDLIVLTRSDEVLAASYRPAVDRDVGWDLPLTPARLLTGARSGRSLHLREWSARNDESATIVATLSAGTLRGTWRERGASKDIRFLLRRETSPFSRMPPTARSSLTQTGRTTPRVVDRLHIAVRTSRWADAAFEARLLCVVTFALPTEDGCDWIDAVAALAEGRDPPSTPRAAGAGLVLERGRQYVQAFDSYLDGCGLVRSSCSFMLDLLNLVEPDKQRAGLARACRYARLGCDTYWGVNEVALVDAARRGDVNDVEKLLTSPVNINAGGEGLMLTPLQAAVLARSFPIVKALLSAGADPNHPSSELLSGTAVGLPLDYAVGQGFDDIALWLLAHGAKANAGQALATAVMMGKRAIVRKILENGEDPDEKPFPAGSALMMAVENRDSELVKELVNHGADPDFSTNFSNGSPIDLARRTGQRAILQVLIAGRKSNR